MSKLRFFKLEEKNEFNIDKALNKAVNIYNNTTHSVIRIEPIKAFKFKKKKDINKIIQNTIKSQINENKNSIIVKTCSKALLVPNFVLKGITIKEKKKAKKLYEIPIIIENSIGGTKQGFKVTRNLKNNKVYEANYKLIKFCSNELQDKFNN